jgi:beta-N-acetylhexosaminidase
MTTHVVIDAIDGTQPATMSRRILTGLLRGELGFTGVVCTDCLEMDAIGSTIGTVNGAVRALAAGADLLLISHTLALAEETAAAIVAAVADGSLSRTRLDEAADRVGRMRERFSNVIPFAGAVDTDAPLEAARRAVTVVRGAIRLRDERPVTVLSFEGRAFDGAGGARIESPSLSSALRARRWKSEVMRVPLEPDADDLLLLLSHLPALGDRNFVVVTRRAHLYASQSDAVARILAVVPDAIVISANEPYDIFEWPAARNVAAIYGDDEIAFAGCADVLTGRMPGIGRLPIGAGDVSVG